jgi:midasin
MDAQKELAQIVEADIHSSLSFTPTFDSTSYVQLGPFAIHKGPLELVPQKFNFAAPTTQDNAMRVVRAYQVHKPILLEGSPGVGKTSLIAALANVCGYPLHRINLSDQTDIMDLFGCDLPVEGGKPGEFVWKDAEFLRALQNGHWVLLDEMNLASQAVLEGLNAVLDHRGAVYIPELGRSFTRHPSFRIFAAQNPQGQGGGRKGLPKSFVNRFTKVYVQELCSSDLLHICRNVLSSMSPEALENMIAFNTRMNDAVTVRRLFGHNGSPWEFNLRDLIRWGTLCITSPYCPQPSDFVSSIYAQRFRSETDRDNVYTLYRETFGTPVVTGNPNFSISPTYMQVGRFRALRKRHSSGQRSHRVLKMHLSALEGVGHCISQSWLAIVVGHKHSGKKSLVRMLAELTGNSLREIILTSSTDTMDILGTFEQLDLVTQVRSLVRQTLDIWADHISRAEGAKFSEPPEMTLLRRNLQRAVPSSDTFSEISQALQALAAIDEPSTKALLQRLNQILHTEDPKGQFEWVDGPLVRAMKRGEWLLLEGANLCNASVLDRLNSLFETDGCLFLNERGLVNGQVQRIVPHPNFRVFMTVDPHYGELSRAMRNRGIEIAMISVPQSDDKSMLLDHFRLPRNIDLEPSAYYSKFEGLRRGLGPQTTVQQDIPSSGYEVLRYSSLANIARWLDPLSPQQVDSKGDRDTSLLYFSRVSYHDHGPLQWRYLRLEGFNESSLDLLRRYHQVCLPVVTRSIERFWKHQALVWGVPSDTMSTQVS